MIGPVKFQAQPYRKGPRQPGAALTAMLKGTGGNHNPSDTNGQRQMVSKTARTPRQPRPSRPTRPTR